MSVNMSGSGAVGLGVGVGSYQPGVYVPLKALFLVSFAPGGFSVSTLLLSPRFCFITVFTFVFCDASLTS